MLISNLDIKAAGECVSRLYREHNYNDLANN